MSDLGKFVHLHVHSAYSMLDGAIQLKSLVKTVKELGMGAVALTDHGNLFALYPFQKACEGSGVKPLFGCETYLSATDRFDRTSPLARTRYHFLLLCENVDGYRNLSRLSTKSYLEGYYYKPRIDMDLLQQHHEGLVATSACIQSPICQAILEGKPDQARKYVDDFVQIFGKGNFYLELMEHGIPEQHILNEALIDMGAKMGVPLVATNDCHYLAEKSYDAHDVLLCIQMGKTLSDPDRMRFEQNEFYLKPADDMIKLFGHVNGAIKNTLEIAERCNCVIPTKQKLLPKFKTPNGEPSDEYLRMKVQQGLMMRYNGNPPEDRVKQAQFELSVIERMGFVDYFLVVSDFIQWAKSQDIPVGPGRGSGAGSIVAYCLQITNLDPMPHGLLFERFLNPERVSMPDFDIDFCVEGRQRVIEYVRDLYGRECVSQIITFGTIKAKSAIRDVGRAMGLPLDKVNSVAKLVVDGPKVTLAASLGEDEKHPEMAVPDLKALYESDSEVKELIDRAKGVEGAIRQPGTHAAGVVICDKPLIDIIPLYRPPDDTVMPATQYNMIEVEEIGLLKMDFLGLKNLTLIDRCIKSINKRFGSELKADDIPLDDEPTYKLLQSGKGLGLFQLESSGMRDLLVNFKPTKFSDLVALISLYRPGPMDNIPEFIERKEGRSKIFYEDPCIEPILKETYGLFVYQEQVMQVAQVMGGYTLGGADMLRRAMSKKKAEEMAKERLKFTAGCVERGIDKEAASRVFDTMEKFAAYGFNKSHAAAYAVVTIQTAWLKAHYPVDFYSSLITYEVGGEDAKIEMYFDEARDEGITCLAPDINTSSVHFEPIDDHRIRFGLCSIKGVGVSAVESLVKEREAGGPFKSLQDMVTRLDKKMMNARTVECLIKCGCFDKLSNHNRPSLLAALPKIMELAGAARKEADSSQFSLFDMMDDASAGSMIAEVPIPRTPDWTDKQRFDIEKELAGFYLSGHPLERFTADFAAFSTCPANEIQAMRKGDDIEWAGLIKRMVPRTDKNGRMFAFAECEDMSGGVELTFFSDAFAKCREFLKEGEVIWVRGRIDVWKDNKKILVNDAKTIDAIRADRIRALEIVVPVRAITEARLSRIKELAAVHRGRRRLWVLLKDGADEARYELNGGCGITPTSALIRELQDADFVKDVRFVIKPLNNGNGDRDDGWYDD